MSDAPAAPAKQVKKATKAKKPKAPAAHPPVAQMVTAAINNLKERNGSSLAAIKKYIAANYKCDVAKLAPFIRKFLKKGVADGKLKQIKGSFKVDKTKVEKPKKKSPKKAKKPKKAKTPSPRQLSQRKHPSRRKPRPPRRRKQPNQRRLRHQRRLHLKPRKPPQRSKFLHRTHTTRSFSGPPTSSKRKFLEMLGSNFCPIIFNI